MKNNKSSLDKIIGAAQHVNEKKFWLDKLDQLPGKSCFFCDFKQDLEIPRFVSETITIPSQLSSRFLQLSNQSHLRLHMIMAACVLLLINKYSGNFDIIVGIPIYRQDISAAQDRALMNTALPIRVNLRDIPTFKELLIRVRQCITEAVDNINYPLDFLLEELAIDSPNNGDSPLFDIAVLLTNIHDTPHIRSIKHNLDFIFHQVDNDIRLQIDYNSSLYRRDTIKQIASHLIGIFNLTLLNIDTPLNDVDILSTEEKNTLLYHFNDTAAPFPFEKTIHRLFIDQAQRTPKNIAAASPLHPQHLFSPRSCFTLNPYLYRSALQFPHHLNSNTPEDRNFLLLKTHHHNILVVNRTLDALLPLFNGKNCLSDIYSALKDLSPLLFVVYIVKPGDLLEITYDFDAAPSVFDNVTTDYNEFTTLVQLLRNNHIIELSAVETTSSQPIPLEPDRFLHNKDFPVENELSEVLRVNRRATHSPTDILLIGDTPGMPSTGLLYIASFLRRNGINPVCRFYDASVDYLSMKKNIETLLENCRPRIVGISLKWFLYIARVLDISRIVKDYSRDNNIPIQIVIGGNTASFYSQEIIRHDFIDFLILGDAELPLLQLCRGDSTISNCLYKKDGNIFQTPFDYIKDESNSNTVYLSHLHEIVLSPHLIQFGTFFIYTHLGCVMNCHYCGGCREAQVKTFNRTNVFIRPPSDVRKDIIEVLPYASTFQFDFDIAHDDLLGYCRKTWDQIDLSRHFASISSMQMPSQALIRLTAKTFKYVYWDLDILTLSGRHRMDLFSQGLVKPQPTDNEILETLERCDPFDNIKIRLNLIAGLPCTLEEDLEAGEKFLAAIMTRHPSFSELHWARLHAQPGAPIVQIAPKYHMHSFAATYEEFLQQSKEKFNSESNTHYSRLEFQNYPYLYFNNDSLNSKITLHYSEMNKKIRLHQEKLQGSRLPLNYYTYEQLDRLSNQLVHFLMMNGMGPNTIAALLLDPSPALPLAILAVLKSGGAYMPIDPLYPGERIKFMLEDSQCKLAITTADLISKIPPLHHDFPVIDLDNLQLDHIDHRQPDRFVLPTDLIYTIYTSGTTGKPKGVLLDHRNIVNYVHWFTLKTHLTHLDNALLTSSYAFDLGYTSIYPSLLNGAALHLVPKETYLIADDLLTYIKQHRVAYLKITPSLFSLIVRSSLFSPQFLENLRLIVLGGEPIDIEDVETAHRACKSIEIMNHYGPTEAAIGCAAQYIDFNDFSNYKRNPTIGKPIANTSIFILDKHFNLVPPLVPGELFIAGVSLARGYLNRPELTAERFVLKTETLFEKRVPDSQKRLLTVEHSQCPNKSFWPHLFTKRWGSLQKEPLGALYKTGDLARWLPNGHIEFLGRIDNQVKIRGYRVELGEIALQLKNHPFIKDSTVIAIDDSISGKKLCAYIVPQENSLSPGDLSNSIHREYTAEEGKSLIQKIQNQAAQYPHHTAVKTDLYSITYKELYQRAQLLAQSINDRFDDRFALSPNERKRYKRQMLLNGWGTESQEKLKSTTVFVGGAGGGGSPTITQLALAGFGTIIICDYDDVELSNLNRQFLHDESRIGMNKALSAKMTVNRLNPNINVIAHPEKLTKENANRLIGDVDIIFDMFDDLGSKFLLSEYAISKQIPHIVSAMVDISSYAAIFYPPFTPCYHCLFDKNKFDELKKVKDNLKNVKKKPLHVVASSLFTSTGFAVTESLKIILGLENPGYNKFFFFNQRASANIVNTDGYNMMTIPFSSHFKQISQQQGFDWEKGWRGRFLEELDITPNPSCPACSSITENQKQNTLSIATIINDRLTHNNNTQTSFITPLTETLKEPPKVASLIDSAHRIPGILLGSFAAHKNLVTLCPHSEMEQLSTLLDDSGARVIITHDQHFNLAQKLNDQVNKRISIINIDQLDPSPGPSTEMNPEKEQSSPRQLLNGPLLITVTGSQPVHSTFKNIYDALCDDRCITLQNNPETTNHDLDLANLRNYLLKKIPEYMIPSHFVPIEKIPLTPNGKLDTRALPKPGDEMQNYRINSPIKEIDVKIAQIWASVLGIDFNRIGIQTNFFELGGNSLSLIMMISKIQKEFGVEIPITHIYENPIIKEISTFIESRKHTDTDFMLLNRDKKEMNLFCFPPIIGFGLVYQHVASILDECSLYAFNFIESEDRLERYANTIIDIQPGGPYVLFGWSAAGRLTFQVAKALEKKGCCVSDIIFADCFFTENAAVEFHEKGIHDYNLLIEKSLETWGANFLKEKVTRKTAKYRDYCQKITSLEQVDSHIHLILSEQNRDNPRANGWETLTSKSFQIYQGFGKHGNMINPGSVEMNTVIIRNILKKSRTR